MENIRLIEGENAVLVPIKKWERVQSELVRLRKRVNQAKGSDDIPIGTIEIKKDLRRDPDQRKIRMTAYQLPAEFKN